MNFFLVTLLAKIGDMGTELYTRNKAGIAIWSCLDVQRSLHTIAKDVADEFNTTTPGVTEKDILRLMEDLERRKMVVAP
jgi:hypothetical protein